MAGSRTSSRITSEPTGSYGFFASHHRQTKKVYMNQWAQMGRELACEPAIFQIRLFEDVLT